MDLPFYTANVLVSTSKKDMDAIFLNPDSSMSPKKKSLSEIISDTESTFVFEPGRDSGLIRLTDSFLNGASPIITLEFVDPGKDFENALLSNDLQEELMDVFSVPDIQPPGLPSIYTGKTVADKISDVAQGRDAALAVGVSPADHLKTKSDILHPGWVVPPPPPPPPKGPKDKALSNLIKNDVAMKGNVYIAYGEGADTSKWTIQSGKLIDASISLNKGSREITLKFIPSFDALSIEQLMANSNLTPLDHLKGTTRLIQAQAKPLEDYTSGKYHQLFVDIIQDYLKKVTGLDSIVFLPDTEKLFSNHLDFIESTELVSVSEEDRIRLLELDVPSKNIELISIKGSVNAFLTRFGIYVAGEPSSKSYNNAYVAAEKMPQLIDTHWRPRITKQVTSDNLKEAYRSVFTRFESAYYSTEYVPLWEFNVMNNMKILKIWHDTLKIGDGINPVVVYGDRRLIDQYLYFSNRYKETDPISDSGGVSSEVVETSNQVRSMMNPRVVGTGDMVGRRLESAVKDKTTTLDLTHVQKIAAIDLLLDRAKAEDADGKLIESLKEKLEDLLSGSTRGGFPSNIARTEDIEKYDVIKSDMVKFNTNHAREMADNRNLKDRDISKVVIETAESFGFPIFRSNTASIHDNIKSINLNLHKFYWAALQSGYSSSTFPRLAAAMAKNPKKAEELYGKLLGDISKLIKFYSSNGIASDVMVSEILHEKTMQKKFRAKFGSIQNYPLLVFTSIALSLQNSASTIVTSPNNPLNPVSIQMHVLEQLTKYAYEMTIETTPMFHLAGSQAKHKSCIVLSNDFDIHGVLKKEVKFRRDQAFDGSYIIFGYEHTISASEVSSKFDLTKLPASA